MIPELSGSTALFLIPPISLGINAIFCILLSHKDYPPRVVVLFWALGLLLPLQSAAGLGTFPFSHNAPLSASMHTAMGLLVAAVVLDLGFSFLRINAHFSVFSLGRMRIPRVRVLSAIAVVAAVASVVSPLFSFPTTSFKPRIITREGIIVYTILALLFIAAFYKLEVAYRAAPIYLRRMARLYFLGSGTIICMNLLLITRLLLFKSVGEHYPQAQALVNVLCFPLIMTGNLRYRLAHETVVVAPNAVFSSLTLLFIGTYLITLSTLQFVAQSTGTSLDSFEVFTAAFTAVFTALVLGLVPTTLRRRIFSRLRRLLDRNRYDYRDLFYRVHEHRHGPDLNAGINHLIDCMSALPSVSRCRVFLHNRCDGNCYCVALRRFTSLDGRCIPSTGPIISAVIHSVDPIYGQPLKDLLAQHPDSDDAALIGELNADLLLPVYCRAEWAGFAAMKTRIARLQDEDLAVLRIFTDSLSEVILHHRTIHERTQRVQLEFFSQFSSFVVHEIKNQTATLVMMTKNAADHIHNPAYQKSLLKSLKSCADNLQSLIARLGATPKPENIRLAPVTVDEVINEALDSTGARAVSGLSVQMQTRNTAKVLADRISLFHILKNLVGNALDATPGEGTLLFRSGTADTLPEDLFFALPPDPTRDRGRFLYITVEDTGRGMPEEFMREKLFRPFSTTKEKGFGVGLYQSKLLVESMQGQIHCHSEPGKGTRFCILLPMA